MATHNQQTPNRPGEQQGSGQNNTNEATNQNGARTPSRTSQQNIAQTEPNEPTGPQQGSRQSNRSQRGNQQSQQNGNSKNASNINVGQNGSQSRQSKRTTNGTVPEHEQVQPQPSRQSQRMDNQDTITSQRGSRGSVQRSQNDPLPTIPQEGDTGSARLSGNNSRAPTGTSNRGQSQTYSVVSHRSHRASLQSERITIAYTAERMRPCSCVPTLTSSGGLPMIYDALQCKKAFHIPPPTPASTNRNSDINVEWGVTEPIFIIPHTKHAVLKPPKIRHVKGYPVTKCKLSNTNYPNTKAPIEITQSTNLHKPRVFKGKVYDPGK